MTPLLGWVIGFDAKKGTVPLLLPPPLLLLSNSLLAFCVKGGVQGKREILVGGFLLPGVSNGCFSGVCWGRRCMQSTLLSSGCWGDRVVNNARWSRKRVNIYALHCIACSRRRRWRSVWLCKGWARVTWRSSIIELGSCCLL